jgi:hypothetical protein
MQMRINKELWLQVSGDFMSASCGHKPSITKIFEDSIQIGYVVFEWRLLKAITSLVNSLTKAFLNIQTAKKVHVPRKLWKSARTPTNQEVSCLCFSHIFGKTDDDSSFWNLPVIVLQNVRFFTVALKYPTKQPKEQILLSTALSHLTVCLHTYCHIHQRDRRAIFLFPTIVHFNFSLTFWRFLRPKLDCTLREGQ